MKRINFKRGFEPITIVIIIAVVLIIGAGGYYVAKKASKPAATDTSVQGDINATTTASVQVSRGSLRSLWALGKDLTCTITVATTSVTTTGTVYLSGETMRGDFVVTSQSTGTTDSHMIKTGNTIYAWSGTQGAKIDVSKFEGKAASQSNINLDQQVDYKCSNWVKDATKFTLPTGVTFVDLSTVINTQINAGTSQCASCEYLQGAEKTQCKTVLKCK